MDRLIEIGEQAFMEKERGTLWALGREPTSSVLIATTLMTLNIGPSNPNHLLSNLWKGGRSIS